MFRKLVIALGATAVIGAAALAPTAASAKGGFHHHGHWGHGWGIGVGFYPGYVGDDCYVVKKVVLTPVGYQTRYVTVCN